MIKIQRTDIPIILVRKAKEWTKKLLSARTKKQHNRAKNKYRHKDIKEALVSMFHGNALIAKVR